MWNSFKTDSQQAIVAGISSFVGGNGDLIHAYVARPEGPGPFPGIVLIHHLPGWDELFQEFARRFANHGYTVICPDLYCRAGHGTSDDVAAKVRKAAAKERASVSAWLAEAAETKLLLDNAGAAIAEWEKRHGQITDDEMRRVRAKWRG